MIPYFTYILSTACPYTYTKHSQTEMGARLEECPWSTKGAVQARIILNCDLYHLNWKFH